MLSHACHSKEIYSPIFVFACWKSRNLQPPRSGSAVGKSCGSRGTYLGENYKKIRETALAIKKMPSSQEVPEDLLSKQVRAVPSLQRRSRSLRPNHWTRPSVADRKSTNFRLQLLIQMNRVCVAVRNVFTPSFTKKKDVVTKITESEPEMKKLYIMEGTKYWML
ncbi:60S ribosomal protein L17 [Culex quinquefasciatus]|uniref:60S ribosomal protein L17 n=1 Tax=Culex quinquefasciatus TaxID=7176 RepID=B0X2U2_CULQU|nr:60S ribosomal protein L17 [Culex quinquefasciatus]|eukprot:XP_001863964.1 60S ribosomal protein L17 [Culex quinquefasciatus]